MVAVRQSAAGHGLQYGDAFPEVPPSRVAALLALVDKEFGDTKQLNRHAPHQMRKRVLQPENAA